MSRSLKTNLIYNFSDCLCSACEEGRCKLRLDSLRRRSLVIVDGIKYQEMYNYNKRLCDRLIFYLQESIVVSVVELTGGRMDAEKTGEQIINGARVAESAIGTYRAEAFFPIALYGRRTHSTELKVLAKVKLYFQNKSYHPIIERCGSSLKSMMETYHPS